MKYLIPIVNTVVLGLCLAVAGCGSIQYPIIQFDLPENACTEGEAEFTWKGETRPYTLHLTDDTDQLYEWCGKGRNGEAANACIKGSRIYTPERCELALAHELNHLFDQHWVDRPEPKNLTGTARYPR